MLELKQMKINKNTSKNIIIAALVIIIGLLTISNNSSKNLMRNEKFENKQSCLQFQNQAQKITDNLEEVLGKIGDKSYIANLENVFYSPNMNECLFTVNIKEYSSKDGMLDENSRYSIYKFGSESPFFNGNLSEYETKIKELESELK